MTKVGFKVKYNSVEKLEDSSNITILLITYITYFSL